ncbi:MAG TPA: cyanophycin synthetase, partial [Segetibacter sp.]|nr:cyanophycin synthetase [Segetibacter sp.]
SNHIILDDYNANPTSMQVAIENISKIKSGSKVLILGGMMELGDESLQEHQNIIDLVKKYTWNKVLLVGGDFAKIAHPFLYFNNST